MTKIHPQASVGDKAQLGDNIEVGPFAVIEDGAVLGDGCYVGPHAYITEWARIGNEVKVHKGAVVGSIPQDLKFDGEETTLEVGDRTVVREFASLNRGTKHSGKSTVGTDCLIMAYTHVAHDCRLGNHVILANSVNMGGHVQIDDWAIIGGMVPIHQFVRIGKHAFVGGGFRVPSDVPPYIRAAGEPLIYKGLNSLGLERRGFSRGTMTQIRKAYRLIYRSGLNISQALQRIPEEVEMIPEVRDVIGFIETRKDRGIMK